MTVNIPNDHNMFLLFILCLQVFEIGYINLFPQALIDCMRSNVHLEVGRGDLTNE